MYKKFVFIITGLLILSILTACGPSAITVQPQPLQRTITVTGTGKIILTPDMAEINIGVHTEDPSANKAMSDNNAKAEAVIATLKRFGVEDKDIKTTNFSIYPSQNYDQNGQPTTLLYIVQNTVYVTVRDLSKLGDLLDEVTKSGANNIYGIQFDVADKTAATSQAREAAVADAQKQAAELTKAAGVKLGEVQTISYYDNNSSPIYAYPMAEAMRADGASVPISQGTFELTTTVTIIYELK